MALKDDDNDIKSELSVSSNSDQSFSAASQKFFMEVKKASATNFVSDDITIDLTGPVPVVGVLNWNDNNNQVSEKIAQNDDENETTQFYINKLSQDASQKRVVTNNLLDESKNFKDVSDIDPQLLKEGKEFIQRNFFAIIISHLFGIAFLIGIKPIQALLLRTGSIHKKETSLKRYLSLILSLINLYECDLVLETENGDENDNGDIEIKKPQVKFNQESRTGKELEILRRKLTHVSKTFNLFVPPPSFTMKLDENEVILLEALKKDLDHLSLDNKNESISGVKQICSTVNPTVPLSQFDLAMLQFALFGFISLFPKTFGIHETNNKKYPNGLLGFTHVWSVLAKRLGLDDEFNLCKNPNNPILLNHVIFKEIFLYSFKLADENLIKLFRTMNSGSCRYFFFFRTKAMIQFMLSNVAQIKDSNQAVYHLMNCFEKFCYYCHQFCVNWLLRYWVTRTMINYCAKMCFFFGCKIYMRRIKLQKEKYELNRDIFVPTIY